MPANPVDHTTATRPTRHRPDSAAPVGTGPTPLPPGPDDSQHPATAAPAPDPIRRVPGHRRLLQVVMAVAIVGGPLAFDLGGILSPSIHESAASSIAASAAANPIGNVTHLVAFVLASYLLPIGAVGLAYLAYRRTPWLATVAGLLTVVGWLPFSALTALDDLTNVMARSPDGGSYAGLLDRFSTGPVMGSYLAVYIVGHLVAYVLFGIALRRARAIPRWAAWAMIASSPLTIAAFVLPGSPRAVGGVALTLLVLGSLPAARRALVGAQPAAARTIDHGTGAG